MRRRFLKFSRARAVALALGVGALGSLATAPASFAAGAGPHPPAVGTNCQTDGKISGAGSTFQANELTNALIYGFQQDICGPVGTATNLNSAWGTTDPSIYTATVKGVATPVSGMATYNYILGGVTAKSGSGAGLNRISCRTDAFGGSDLPYTAANLTAMNGAPGLETGGVAPNYNCTTNLNLAAVPPPFGPVTASYPNTADAVANVMNFPIGGGAVAAVVNMHGVCTGGTPTTINITSQEFNFIWQGKINQWNDPALVATNPILSTDSCSGNIQRVVRQDNSGTTGLMFQDLGAGESGTAGIDTGTLCDGQTWSHYFGLNPNTSWPLGCADGTGNIALPPVNGGVSGSPTLITKLEGTPGGIGYAELGLWGTLPAGDVFAGVESQAATAANGLTNNTPPVASFIAAGASGASSNCSIGVLNLPGTHTANEAVGLGVDNYASDQTVANNHENITYSGPGYPVCGLTFDLVYTGMHNETGEAAPVTGASLTVQGPEIGTTNDQLRTLYSFFTYVFSPLGQSYLDQATYDELPGAWLLPLRQGFQNNF
jgi:ABC-type phosphate transport system substrate-binding protein